MIRPLIFLLLLPAVSLGAEKKVSGTFNAKHPPGRSDKRFLTPFFRVYYADGTILNGRLQEREVRIDTPVGELSVAVDKLRSLTPKIARQARRSKRITQLIGALGAAKFSDRERAQQELATLGSDVRTLLEAVRDDADLERRARARKLLAGLGPRRGDADEGKDRLEANGNVVLRGRLLTKRISLRTPYGDFSTDLSDVDFLGPAEAGKPLNLLKKIDPARDTIGRRWTLDKETGTLTSPKAKFARIQIPLDVPAAYQLDMVVTPRVGRSIGGRLIPDSLLVAIVVDGHPCQVVLNGFTNLGKGTFSGLDRIDGKRPFEMDSHKGEIFALGRASTIRFLVQPGRVRVDCDEVKIVDWQGDSAVLTTHPAWLLRRPKSLGLGSYETSYEFSRLLLTPLHRVPPMPKLADGYALLELRDGQRIVGKPLDWPTLKIGGDPSRRFALQEVVVAKITDAGKKVEARLRGGATATAAMPPEALRIVRKPGTLTIPLADIQRIIGPPAGESK